MLRNTHFTQVFLGSYHRRPGQPGKGCPPVKMLRYCRRLTAFLTCLLIATLLATIAAKQPKNLTIVVLDNGHFGETGMQRSHSSLGTNLVAVAKGFGIADAFSVNGTDACADIAQGINARRHTSFVQVFIEANEPPRMLPPRDGPYIKNRFRHALGLQPF